MRLYLPSFLSCVVFLTACGHSPIDYNVKPRQEPVYNFTQSSKVLSCLGEKIDRTDKTPIDVYISDIPDHTTSSIESGFLTKNAVMMVTTALDRLNTEQVAVIGKNGAMRSRKQVQILGSFTELNRTIQSRALSSEAVFPGGFELELGADKSANHIALDLAMSEQNRIIPKTATSVSVQIHGNSGDATITYDEGDDFAAIGAIGFSGQEGFHSGQRLLIETSVALMMSKYFQVDIRSCLKSSQREKAPKINTDFDAPVFDRAELASLEAAQEAAASPQSVAVDTGAKPMALQARQVSETPAAPQQRSYPRRQKPQMIAPAPEPDLGIDDNAYAIEEPKQLPQENGVVVLPTPSGPRYLRAQPREYVQSNNENFSGIPDQNVPDPAADNDGEFLEEQESELPRSSSSYDVTF